MVGAFSPLTGLWTLLAYMLRTDGFLGVLRAARRYTRTVLAHRRAVAEAGRVLSVPRWALLTHDLSKFRPSEFIPYMAFFELDDPGDPDNVFRLVFLEAVQRHYARNPHHPEHWGAPDSAPYRMSKLLLREMVADWLAAGKAYEGRYPDSLKDWVWFQKNVGRFRLTLLQRRFVNICAEHAIQKLRRQN